MNTAIVLSVVAILVSSLALLVSIGVAMRANQRSPVRHFGLQAGAQVPRGAIKGLFPGLPAAELMNPGAVIALLSSGCAPCETLIQSLNELSNVDDLRLFLIEAGPESDRSLQDLARFPAHWAHDPDGIGSRAFETAFTPHVFIVKDGLIVENVGVSDAHSIQAKVKALNLPQTAVARL